MPPYKRQLTQVLIALEETARARRSGGSRSGRGDSQHRKAGLGVGGGAAGLGSGSVVRWRENRGGAEASERQREKGTERGAGGKFS